MRILHVVATLDPALGGPPMIAARLAAGQARLGHDVHVATIEDPRRSDAVACALAMIPDHAKVKVHAVGASGLFDKLLGHRAKGRLKPLISDSNVVHLHGVWNALLLVAATLCRRLGRPYFILLHGALDPWSLQQKTWKKRIALALAYRRMLNGAAALHLGNKDEQLLIEPLGLRRPGPWVPRAGRSSRTPQPRCPIPFCSGADRGRAGRVVRRARCPAGQRPWPR